MARSDPVPGYPKRLVDSQRRVVIRPDSFPPGPGSPEIVIRGPGWKANIPVIALTGVLSMALTWALNRVTPSASTEAIEQEMRTYREARQADVEYQRQQSEALKEEIRQLRTEMSLLNERTRK
jgi:hypothetical protein